MLTAQETAVRRFYSRRSRICVEHSQFVEHRNKHRPREVFPPANGRYGSLTMSKVDLTEQRAAQSARLAVRMPIAFPRQRPRCCGSPCALYTRVWDRGRDRHERARVHLFRFVLRVRLNRPSAMRSVSISQHHESQLRGLRHGFGPTVCIELGENRSDMKLGGVERNAQATGDRLV